MAGLEGPIAAKAGPLLTFVVLLRAGWPGVEIGGWNGAQAACSYPLQSGVALREDHRYEGDVFGVTSVSEPGFRAQLTHVPAEEPTLPAEVPGKLWDEGL